jgi:acyl-[acyl-carrier-protein]-phospholipid O-acyltransferase / long-chain-fatty-acid--[acyl-carrier-protein] ligase
MASFFRFLKRLPGFSHRASLHSLAFLNSAQFFGVLNDNLFKFVIVYLLIDIEGREQASNILSAVGALFVAPFLLFSSAAGVLADRFSKQRLLMLMKGAEITIMLVALFAFTYQSAGGCYLLLFLLSTHSAIFGPSKYGIIPELVPQESISKANGLITSFTYLAMIIGTFLASFLTEITGRDFTLIAGFCLLVAICGFLSTLGIKRTPAQHSKKKIRLFFLREIYHTLLFAKGRHHLLSAILGAAYFLFIGAYTQLNIIPFAIQSLHLSPAIGGYLFLSTALGIAVGAIIAGKLSKKTVELGLSCLSGFFIALSFFLLWVFSSHFITVISLLIFLGICGGAFIVPFESFVQLFSPNEKRGQVIAAVNFLSFCGVLLASFVLYLFSEPLKLSSASGFAIMGIITLVISALFTLFLSDLLLSYISRKFLIHLFPFRTINSGLVDKKEPPLFILQRATWRDALLLLSLFPETHFILPHPPNTPFSWFRLRSLHFLSDALPLEELLQQERPFCLLINEPPKDDLPIYSLLKKERPHLIFAHFAHPQRKGEDRILIFSKDGNV